jgi:putative membrane protein
MGMLLSWLVMSAAIYLTAIVLPGFEVRGFGGALIVAIVFGLLNWLVGWALFALLGVVTLGIGFLLAFITRWFVNAILLKVTDALSSNIRIRSFGVALLGALLISALCTVGEHLVMRLV